jgi:hypothetical protein
MDRIFNLQRLGVLKKLLRIYKSGLFGFAHELIEPEDLRMRHCPLYRLLLWERS